MKLKLFEQFISEGVEADIMPAAPVTPAGAASSAPGTNGICCLMMILKGISYFLIWLSLDQILSQMESY